MISIIISSQKKNLLDKVSENIRNTIGVAYEVIGIENSEGKFGICKAYNMGAAKARYDIFCFMHEDVLFETQDWGKKVIQHLSDTKTGLLGLAGGDTKSIVPSSWSSAIYESEISIIQHYVGENNQGKHIVKTGYPNDPSLIKPVACIDGVWMCTRRDVYATFQFDEKTFTGFHGYDIDYSLQVGQQYKIAVIFDIIVHHFSEGKYSKTWMENTILVSTKWREQLPRSVRQLSKQEFIRQHWTSQRVFILYLIEFKYPLSATILLYLKYSANRFFNVGHFAYHFKLLIKERRRRKGRLSTHPELSAKNW